MNNITRDGQIDMSDLKYIGLAEGKRDRFLVRTGDVLFNRTNSPELVGKTAIFRHSTPMAFAGYLIRLRANSSNDPEYLAAFLNTVYAKSTDSSPPSNTARFAASCSRLASAFARAWEAEIQPRLIPVVPAASQLDVLQRGLAAMRIRHYMVKLQECALGAAPVGSDERALLAITLPHGTL